MTWTKDEYARRLREAFQRADRSGLGIITREELVDVFQALDRGSWSIDDLRDLFDAVDTDCTGFIKYKTFISFVMETPPEDEEEDEAEQQEATSDEALAVEVGEGPPAVHLDLERWMSREEWVLVMQRLADEDEREAEAAYGQRVAEVQGHSGTAADADGLPLRELLRELKVEGDDHEARRAVKEAIDAVSATLAQGRRGPLASRPFLGAPEGPALRRAAQQVVRSLHLMGRPFTDATSVLSAGLVPLSATERAAIQELGREPGRLVEHVAACARQPPLLSAVAGLRACHEFCDAEVSAIIARCRAEGKPYTDERWNLATSLAAVLYVDKARPCFDCTVARPLGVRRLAEIVGTACPAPTSALSALYGGPAAQASGAVRATGATSAVQRPALFGEGERLGDIIQGKIGTCFLLGAMGAVSSNGQDAIRSLFVKYDVDVGVYGVRFNIDGEWVHVIVDDQMPVDEHGELLYARSTDPREAWCPVLEKAFCKLHGCYEMCDGGQTSEAISALVGGVSGSLRILQCHREDPGAYFRLLAQARARGWLLTTGFVPPAALVAAEATAALAAGCAARTRGKCGEATLASGLIGGHAYSVLRLVEAQGQQLVCLRNPWGSGEWTGRWSGRNAEGEWTQAMRRATGFKGGEDGLFWMSIQDFVAHSAGVEYARSFGPDWKKVTHYARFRHGQLLATARCDYVADNEGEISFAAGDQLEVTALCGSFWWRGRPWRVRTPGSSRDQEGFFPAGRVQVNERPAMRFDLDCLPADANEPMTAVVVLSQPSAPMQRRFFRRREDGQHCKDVSYPRLQLCILSPEGRLVAKRAGRRRCLWVELQLPGGGCWRLYALSLDGIAGAFSLRAYVRAGSAGLTEVPGASLADVYDAPAAPA